MAGRHDAWADLRLGTLSHGSTLAEARRRQLLCSDKVGWGRPIFGRGVQGCTLKREGAPAGLTVTGYAGIL